MKRYLIAGGAAVLALASAPVSADTLTTGTGDGQVVLNVDGFGHIANGNAIYNPVGAIGGASTIFYSSLLYRVGATGTRADVFRAGTLVSFTGTDTSRTSVFTLSGLSVALTQSVSNLLDTNNVQTGSQLTQTYTFTNLGTAAVSLDLARYLDGDLLFDGSRVDGGGRLTVNGAPLLFEIDSATGASTSTTFLGLYNTGGTQNGFQIQRYDNLSDSLLNGNALANTIQNDADNDGFVDAGFGYDVALGLGTLLSNIQAGGSASFSTVTLFGSGAPGQVVIPPTNGAVPEPATWAMMLIGFGGVGYAMRRRKGEARVRYA